MNASLKIALTAGSTLLALAPAAVLILLPPSAAAQTPSQVAVRVAVGDLDASSIDGARIAKARIAEAARKACNEVATYSPLNPREIEVCRRTATGTAADQLFAQDFDATARPTRLASAQ